MIVEGRLHSLVWSWEFLQGLGGEWELRRNSSRTGWRWDEAKPKDTNSFPGKEEAAVTRQEGLGNI